VQLAARQEADSELTQASPSRTIPLRFPYGGGFSLPRRATERYNGTPPEGRTHYAKGGFTPPLIMPQEVADMTTMLTEHGAHWVLSQVVGPGKRRRLPRLPVVVEKGDRAQLYAAAVMMAEAARTGMGVELPPKEPVV